MAKIPAKRRAAVKRVQAVEKTTPELDRLEAEVLQEPEHVEPVGEGAPETAIIPLEQFQSGFVGAFQIASQTTGLQSLDVDGHNEGSARMAAKAVYEIASETTMLRWLIEGGNPWMGRAICIGAFAVPMARNVRAEITARRQAKEEANNDIRQPAET